MIPIWNEAEKIIIRKGENAGKTLCEQKNMLVTSVFSFTHISSGLFGKARKIIYYISQRSLNFVYLCLH